MPSVSYRQTLAVTAVMCWHRGIYAARPMIHLLRLDDVTGASGARTSQLQIGAAQAVAATQRWSHKAPTMLVGMCDVCQWVHIAGPVPCRSGTEV